MDPDSLLSASSYPCCMTKMGCAPVCTCTDPGTPGKLVVVVVVWLWEALGARPGAAAAASDGAAVAANGARPGIAAAVGGTGGWAAGCRPGGAAAAAPSDAGAGAMPGGLEAAIAVGGNCSGTACGSCGAVADATEPPVACVS